MGAMRKRAIGFFVLGVVFAVPGCEEPLNHPYRVSERGRNILYTSFSEPPKHLDPAVSYSSDEYAFIGQIYEPPFQYHYLKRPYELVPLTAEAVPEPRYFDADGKPLPRNADPQKVARAVYEIRIKPGIMYQEHPCFAKDASGSFLYHALTEKDIEDIHEIRNFPKTGTRELTAADYIYQIKRLAHPKLHSPVLSTMAKYVSGLAEYATALQNDLEAERNRRRSEQGAMYNQELDEKQNPIRLDLTKHPLPGVESVDRHTYRIILKAKYPQIVYWLAMPFFSSIPAEAVEFYEQPVLIERNITLDRFPVGTGAYRMHTYDPNMEIILVRNENFHAEHYPSEGEPQDEENGLLDDGGKRLPFIERVVHKLEKESIPYWNKFLQGYYDTSGISSDSFDKAIQLSPDGSPALTDYLTSRNIRLATSTSTSTYYYGFNMTDDVVGGCSEENCRLRRAINIAMDMEEFVQIFRNGRGISAQSPLPPGIFGYEKGEEGCNPYLYDWDKHRGIARRRSIEHAKKLLAEAGYPGGKDEEGRPLVIHFDNSWTGPGATTTINWLIKQFKKIDIQMKSRTTDYNRFREKMNTGNFQLFSWGWNADYPDPENFMFLLYGLNGKVRHHGENAANYDSPRFNELFKKMEHMDNTGERLAIIRQMKKIVQHDAPWIGIWHPIGFGLYPEWFLNTKPNLMANNTVKYKRLRPDIREEYRKNRNKPVLWPILALASFVILGSLPAVVTIRRKRLAGEGDR